MTNKITDITPESIKIIPAREKVLASIEAENLGATIGGVGDRRVSTINDAINVDGNFVKDLINTKLDTDSKSILGDFTFGVSGSLKMITDENNGLWISPTGILAKKAGVNTLAVTNAGDVTMTGTITASAGSIGGWLIGTNTITDIAGMVGLSSTVTAGDDIRLWAGHVTPASAPWRVTEAGVMTATNVSITGGTVNWSTVAGTTNAPANNATVGADWSVNLSNIPATLGTPSADGLYLSSTYLGYYKTGAWTSFIKNNGDFYFAGDAGSSIDWNVTTAGTLTIKGKVVAGTGSLIATSYLDGTIPQANLNLSDRGWTQTCVFSVTDADTVAWGVGTFTSADGTVYNISAGNTGNMAAKTFIYLDIAISTTAYQTTTTATTAVGAGKVLIAVAQNGDSTATYSLTETSIFTGDMILANSVVANKLSVTTLSSIVANLGSITAGNITLDTSGYIRGGATDYLTGTGFFQGYSGGAYKFSIGTSTEYIGFNGSTFDITVPINTPHYFKIYMPWKTSNSTPVNIPVDLNKMWEIKCVSSQIVDKPTYLWVGILGENTDSGTGTYYIRLLKYKRNDSGEYDYTGTYWEKSGGAGDQQQIFSVCQYGTDYVYVVWKTTAAWKLSRLDVTNLGNEQTVTGLNSSYPYIASNGTKLYFYNDVTTVKVFTVTNATTVSDDSTDITLASDPGTRHFITDGTSFYFTGTTNIKKYAVSNGALSATSDTYSVPDNASASTPLNRLQDGTLITTTIKDNGGFWSQGTIHRVLQQTVCNAIASSSYLNPAVQTLTYLEAIPCPDI